MLRVILNENEHYSCMFNKLEGMRRDEKHCNFKIKVGSEVLHCHRSILAAGSDYFDAMLSHDTKENCSGVVEMIDADAECVKICVGYIYGGKVEEISMEKCEQLMYVASLMQLQKVCDGIVKFIGTKLDLENYFATKRLADLFGCLKLVEKCEKFAEENFALILKLEDFGDVDKGDLKKMIKSKKVKMAEELKLEALLRWSRQDDERNKFFEEILECVELDKVPVEFLRHLLENEPLITDNLALYKFFSASLLKAMEVGNKQLHDGREVGIVIFNEKIGFLQCFNPRANTWRQMQKMHDEMTKEFFSTVSLDDHIYVLMSTKSVYRLEYSVETETWERMADMIEDHGECPPATVVTDKIYVIGGYGGVVTKAAEKYDPATDQWTKIIFLSPSFLLFQLSSSSEILSVGGNIYSFGGYENGKFLNTVQRLDPLLSSWTDVKPMKEPKGLVAPVELDRKVYVLGGLEGEYLRSCDCYDTDMDESTSFSPMNIARGDFKAFAVDGFIYAVGGYISSPDSIEKYDVEKDKWEMVPIPSGMELKIVESVKVKFKQVANA